MKFNFKYSTCIDPSINILRGTILAFVLKLNLALSPSQAKIVTFYILYSTVSHRGLGVTGSFQNPQFVAWNQLRSMDFFRI